VSRLAEDSIAAVYLMDRGVCSPPMRAKSKKPNLAILVKAFPIAAPT
jgi:hypothetical protein